MARIWDAVTDDRVVLVDVGALYRESPAQVFEAEIFEHLLSILHLE